MGLGADSTMNLQPVLFLLHVESRKPLSKIVLQNSVGVGLDHIHRIIKNNPVYLK